MKVAFDIAALKSGHRVRGIGVMIEEQVRSLQKESRNHKNMKIEDVDFQKVDLSKYDIVHYPYFYPYFNTLPENFPEAKTIVTIQDLIYLIFPDRYPPGLNGRRVYRQQKRKIQNVDRIVTISETTRQDAIKYLKIIEEKIDVVYLAPKNCFQMINDKARLINTKKKYNLPDKFILYVGDVNYNKNIITLMKACEKVGSNLVVVGHQATEIEEMGLKLDTIQGPMDWMRYVLNIPHPELQHFREINEHITDSKIIVRTGFVSENELVDIYNLALLYCQPSLYEGFSFTVQEAMACGTPTIISDIGAHREVAGDATIYFDPENTEALTKKLTKMINDIKTLNKLRKKGLEQVKKFSWEKYAKEMINIYGSVYEE